MVSSTSTAYNLTVHNAASPPYSLKAMTFVVVVFLPLVLAYQAWSYYVFRRRVSASEFQPPVPTPATAPEPEPGSTAPDNAAAQDATRTTNREGRHV
jgi:cytochrome d ubiquinol oxidase subunit II